MAVAFIGDEGTIKTAFNFLTGTYSTISYGGAIPDDCVMKVPIYLWDEMLKEFAELANSKGMKLDSDQKRGGQLEATERHLQDLRAIVFKMPPPPSSK